MQLLHEEVELAADGAVARNGSVEVVEVRVEARELLRHVAPLGEPGDLAREVGRVGRDARALEQRGEAGREAVAVGLRQLGGAGEELRPDGGDAREDVAAGAREVTALLAAGGDERVERGVHGLRRGGLEVRRRPVTALGDEDAGHREEVLQRDAARRQAAVLRRPGGATSPRPSRRRRRSGTPPRPPGSSA